MRKGINITLITLSALLVIILAGPFLVPVNPLEDTQPVQKLADEDSLFIEINGIDIHYKQTGSGKPVFILLHGFGASTFSWREVMEPLAAYGVVIAYDRPAFGLTERVLDWEGDNPYSQESNIAILLGLMDELSFDKAILVGNSAGGTLATAFALTHPNRVQALIEVDAAIYQTMPDSAVLEWLLKTPQMNHVGPLIARSLAGTRGDRFIRSAWNDPGQLENNPEIINGYRKPLTVENWDRALWEHTKATKPPDLTGELDQITIPTLVITGDSDQIVPVENSRQLAQDILGAVLAVLPNCGHLPQEECPQDFMQVIDQFLDRELENNSE